MTNGSGVPIMRSLYFNDSIETFLLHHNSMGDETAQELIETLKRNRVLRKVTLHHNGINIRFLEEVQEQLHRNQTLAIERLKPDIEREILTMKHDRKEYE